MKLLDRYVLRSFIEPFLLCFFGFIAIWLIIDLSDNAQEFSEARASFVQIGQYYLTQLPATVLISLPIGLLLALLFSLSRMSRTNEIISMLTAGRSVVRILLPLFGVGALASAACLWLNWQLAPHAEGIKKIALKQMSKGKKADGGIDSVNGHLFRDRQNNRTWYVRRFRPGDGRFAGVHITQQDETGRITKKWYAARVTYDEKTKVWALERGMTVDFAENGDIAKVEEFSYRGIFYWSETPWRIASGQLSPQGLSVPELRDYLRFNADYPPVQLAPYRAHLADRFALPLSCLVVVFIAAPLGIVFNRRGVLGGVAGAIFIFFIMLMSRYLFLALGSGDRVAPLLAPWIPNLAAGLLGLGLLWMRSTNRDLPTLWRKRT